MKEENRYLIVLRGAPGSGKSTHAKRLCKKLNMHEYRICSADHYFVRPDGLYDWNKNLLSNVKLFKI